ncbi:ATP-binding protein [Rhodovastum atsumiense]|uniref:histidine kinase n=1 Tax=Rhodovastum atsumiense TaxID=504468 RepID=A0A5M6IS08_9PROT|nr:ATP-binding protein [Rhodovastum atsumiense]KAA5610265.1 response regulator [Rhodovastum atsumiense]
MAGALLPALGFQLLAEVRARTAMMRSLDGEALRLATLVAAEQRQAAEGVRQVLATLAASPTIRESDLTRCDRFLANVLAESGRYVALLTVSLDGRPRCVARPEDMGLDFSAPRFVREAVDAGRFVIGGHLPAQGARPAALAFALPYRDAYGQTTGTLVALLSLGWLRGQLDGLPLPPGAASFVVDRDGIVLDRRPRQSNDIGTAAPERFMAALRGGEMRTLLLAGMDGEERLYGLAPLGARGLELGVAVGLDPAAGGGAIRVEAARAGVFILFGTTLALLIAGAAASRTIGRPFRRLLAAASAWRSGRLAARVGQLGGPFEFRELGRALDEMAAASERREQDLRAARDEAVVTGQELAQQQARLREAEAARMAAEAAQHRFAQEQRMEAIGQLTAGVAHDFNNLLQVVAGNLELVEKAARGRGDAREARMLGTALRAVGRGARLTGQLLSFSRRQVLHARLVQLPTLLADIMERIVPVLPDDIAVSWHTVPDIWPCRLDAAHFETALLNVVMNARHAMPEGGKIEIRMGNLRLDAAAAGRFGVPAGDYIEVTVADSGIGMDQDVLDHVFEPFFTTREIGEGSGLGLSQVDGFVRQSGGGVAVSSTPGAGTSVSMLFPREAQGNGAPPAAPVVDLPGSQQRILVVDDDPGVLEVLKATLEDAGYQVTTARNGREALGLLRSEQPFDAVLTDVVMPGGVSGVDVARQASSLRPGIRVLLASGYSQMAEHGIDRRAEFAFLSKPYERMDLLHLLAGRNLAAPQGERA